MTVPEGTRACLHGDTSERNCLDWFHREVMSSQSSAWKPNRKLNNGGICGTERFWRGHPRIQSNCSPQTRSEQRSAASDHSNEPPRLRLVKELKSGGAGHRRCTFASTEWSVSVRCSQAYKHNSPMPRESPPHLSATHHDHRFAIHLPLAILHHFSPVPDRPDPPPEVLFAGFAHNVPGKRLCVVWTASYGNNPAV